MPKGRSCQLKIGNLEKHVYNILSKVQKHTQFVKHNAVLDFTETRRRKFPAGYYPLTVAEQGNESHGVIIEKRISQKGNIRFYIFDPNGKKWANTSGYNLTIRIGTKLYPIYKTISPNKSWNKSGNCGLWNIIMAIVFEQTGKNALFSSYRLKKLYSIFDNIGDNWINELQDDLIINTRSNYSTQGEANMFISAVYGKLAELFGSI
uniref:Uncharacterized protein n=1 Tax=viral metagenome TaxID=1070528 RepID=A0A6C0CQ83_9ZZZZ